MSTTAAAPPTAATGLYSLCIINAAGGLIYSRLVTPHPHLNSNDLLRLASTFHSIHAISAAGIKLHPLTAQSASSAPIADDEVLLPPYGNHGIQSIETADLRLLCLQTISHVKLLLCGHISVGVSSMERLLSSVYLLYTDYVLKNPFYELENPIRIEQFDSRVQQMIGK